jgi:hypothetical protein
MKSLQLPWWEVDELFDYARLCACFDVIENKLIRRSGFSQLYAVMSAPSSSTARYRQTTLYVMPLEASLETTFGMLEDTLIRSTSYGTRKQFEQLFKDELPPHLVKPLAVAAAYITAVGGGYVKSPLPVIAPPADDSMPIGVWLIEKGGYIQLSLRNTRLHFQLSLPHHERYGGGYGLPFTGILATHESTAFREAYALAGWEPPQQEDPCLIQQPSLPLDSEPSPSFSQSSPSTTSSEDDADA